MQKRKLILRCIVEAYGIERMVGLGQDRSIEGVAGHFSRGQLSRSYQE